MTMADINLGVSARRAVEDECRMVRGVFVRVEDES